MSAAAIMREAKLILASVAANNNKFWTIRVCANNDVMVTFGRVGTAGSSKTWPMASADEAARVFDRKCQEKLKSGYQAAKVLAASSTQSSGAKPLFQDTLAEIARAQLCPPQAAAGPATGGAAPPPADDLAARLVSHLVKANTHSIMSQTSLQYDEAAGSFRTPLGIVDQEGVDEARVVLAQIGDLVAGAAPAPDGSWERLVERYLMLIPRDIGRYRPSLKSLFPDLAAVQAQGQVLDSLEASIRAVRDSAAGKAAGAAAAGDTAAAASAPRVFNARLSPVHDDAVVAPIREMYRGGANAAMHAQAAALQLGRVFAVHIDAMAAAFEAKGRAVGGVRRLWHGTRASNVLSILRGGMMVPPKTSAHVTGRLFGDGLYFSDQSTKSLNYSLGYAPMQRGGSGSGASSGEEWHGSVFMFLCDVAMGRAFTPAGPYYSRTYPAPSYDSTFAQGGISGVANNEMIVYETHQALPVFLCEFKARLA